MNNFAGWLALFALTFAGLIVAIHVGEVTWAAVQGVWSGVALCKLVESISAT